MPLRRRAALAAAAGWLAGCGTAPHWQRMDASVPAAAETRAAYAALGPGINFGNMLDAPSEGAWGSRVQDGYAALVHEAGFRHVRLPVRWSAHAGLDAQARIDPAFFARVEGVVDALLGQGLTVVVDMHHYRQFDGDRLDPGEAAVDPKLLRPRFVAMWRQIAARFARHPAPLWFELYNEPHGVLDALTWNALAAEALAAVRASNPTRIVVIGPVHWNSARELHALRLPPDPHLVATVHDYEPFMFTHQQAAWATPAAARTEGVLCCDAGQHRLISEPLDIAQAWSQRHGVPVWLGEFGAYGGPPKRPNDFASRVAYARTVREAAEQRGIAWAWWELDSGFGLYDPRAARWREPLLRALLG